ncbi:MAG: rhodanese-related sulfurtransferase [Beijerinckiaceae bacterium]|nr:rhodanese-related sulfurtransferase [Beijerinckiaceae bacterium]
MIEIAALYHFMRLPHYADLRASLQTLFDAHGVKGIILLAHEGFNGTLAAEPAALHAALEGLRQITGADFEHKTSHAGTMPFLRMKVRLKAEIVTMGEPDVDPLGSIGTYVEPENWNALISDPEVLVIDTRNAYETRIGTFKGALDPQTDSFRDFPAYVRDNLDPARHRKIAMFCTGGIRCEKATSFMKQAGFDEVYHLKGGILKYLETVDPAQSLWNGACFVFDERVAVGHGLGVEDYALCHGCREPLSAEDRDHADYEPGVSCRFCAPKLTPEQKASARERQRQIMLAKARGERHLGPKDQ